MTWIFWAIFAQAAVSVANITDKLLVDKYIKDATVVVVFSGAVAFLIGLFIWIIRGLPIIPMGQTVLILLAGILLEIYLLPYFKAMSLDEVSNVVPLFQLIPVFTLIISRVFLGEVLTIRQYLGFVVILASGLVLSVSSFSGTFKISKTFWLMAFSSFLIAVSMVLFKFIVDVQNLWDSIAYESMGIGLGMILVIWGSGSWLKVKQMFKTVSKAGWTALSTSEGFYIIFRFASGAALVGGSVVLVNVLWGVQPLFVLLYGAVLSIYLPKYFKEDLSGKVIKKKLLAMLAILGGLYLIYI